MFRIRTRFAALGAFLFLAGALAHAETLKLIGWQDFEGPPLVDLYSLRQGVDVSRIYEQWGVRLSGIGSIPTFAFGSYPEDIGIVQPPLPVIRNRPLGDSSAGLPLIVQLDNPARRIGFSPGNGGEGVEATIRAFGPRGNQLGEFTVAVPSHFGEFVGLETTSEEGISRVVLDYGDFEGEEQIAFFGVNFLNTPRFEIFIPQVGDARLPDGSRLTTRLTLLNLLSTTAQGEIQFFDSLGAPLPLEFLEGHQGSEVEPNLNRTPFSLTTNGTSDPPRSGYARIRSDVPIMATAEFRVLGPDGRIASQAGITSEVPRPVSSGAVRRQIPSPPFVPIVPSALVNIDTGIAVVNPWDEEVMVWITLYTDTSGVERAPPFKLGPRGHWASFVSELVGPFMQSRSFGALIQVSGSRELAITLVQTVDGLPAASFQPGGTDR